jgi:hypothetical protein
MVVVLRYIDVRVAVVDSQSDAAQSFAGYVKVSIAAGGQARGLDFKGGFQEDLPIFSWTVYTLCPRMCQQGGRKTRLPLLWPPLWERRRREYSDTERMCIS